MQQRPYTPPIRQVKKTRASHTFRALGLGLAFAGLDYLGYEVHKFYKMFKHVQPEEMEAAAAEKKRIHLPPPPTETSEKAEFNRDDILKALEKTQAKESSKEDRIFDTRQQNADMLKSRFLENFIYGGVLVKIGKEARSYFFNNYFNSVKLTNKLLLSFPIPIISYYAFCNFYESKSLDELIYRLQFDFLLLYSIRVVVANFERKAMFQFEKLTKNIQVESQDPAKRMSNIQKDEILKSAMKKATFSRSMITGVWIFALSYIYKYPFYDLHNLERTVA